MPVTVVPGMPLAGSATVELISANKDTNVDVLRLLATKASGNIFEVLVPKLTDPRLAVTVAPLAVAVITTGMVVVPLGGIDNRVV